MIIAVFLLSDDTPTDEPIDDPPDDDPSGDPPDDEPDPPDDEPDPPDDDPSGDPPDDEPDPPDDEPDPPTEGQTCSPSPGEIHYDEDATSYVYVRHPADGDLRCVIDTCVDFPQSENGYYGKVVQDWNGYRCEMMPWCVFDTYIPQYLWAGVTLVIPIRANVQYPLTSYHLDITYDTSVFQYVSFEESVLHNSGVINPDQPGTVVIVVTGARASTTHEEITGTEILLGTLSLLIVGETGTHPNVLSGEVIQFVNAGTNGWVNAQPIGFHDGAGGYKNSLDMELI
jgi:hypothetical protein